MLTQQRHSQHVQPANAFSGQIRCQRSAMLTSYARRQLDRLASIQASTRKPGYQVCFHVMSTPRPLRASLLTPSESHMPYPPIIFSHVHASLFFAREFLPKHGFLRFLPFMTRRELVTVSIHSSCTTTTHQPPPDGDPCANPHCRTRDPSTDHIISVRLFAASTKHLAAILSSCWVELSALPRSPFFCALLPASQTPTSN